MSFLSGIFTGSNPTLPGAIHNAGNVATYGTGTGMGDTSTASDFLHQIIAGNPAAVSKLLAPQIGAAAGRANQQIQTEGQFANRSGGVNAENQHIMDSERGNIDDMISRLTGGAVSQLGDLGTHLLSLGLNANQQSADLGQKELENQQNSLLGGIISKGVAGGLGMIPGLSSIF